MLATAVAVAVLGCGCSSSRNTAATRNYQAFITRYNIHYNGDKHYRETLEDMERNYPDDFSRMLFVHPAEARGVSGVPQPSGDFTRSVEKAQKAIQLRSIKKRPAGPSATPQQREWKRRTEYNPFLHNSWLMLGRAEYMNGDFAIAANTFLYISRHFKWLPGVVAEARAWEALCYCALGRLYEAEALLAKIPADILENKNIRQTYLTAKSSLLLHQREYRRAAETLTELVEISHGKQKTRLRYLLGQAFSRSGDNGNAYNVFKKIERTLTTDYATRFNARMAMSEVTPPERTGEEIKALEKIARYGSNADYLDQIYYALGNLHLSVRDTVAAEKAYATAVDKSVRLGYEQAKARLALGGLQYAHGRYDLARINYNAALPFLPADHPGIDSIGRRADALDILGELTQTVVLQDSLLSLARMTPQQQAEIAGRLARSYATSQQAQLSETHATFGTPLSVTSHPTASWYFYNPALVKSGKEQFRKVWGDRQLTDNWRISAQNSPVQSNVQSSGEVNHTNDDAGVSHSKPSSQLQPDDPAYYIQSIPDTPERINAAESTIEEAMYEMGTILRNRLDDYNAAAKTWSDLINRFPHSPHRPEICENLFLMYSRMGEDEKARRMRDIIIAEFPGTQLADAMAAPDYLERKKEKLLSQKSIFSRAYEAYIANDNTKLHNIVSQYDSADTATDDNVVPHLLFLDALAFAADGDNTRFASGMKEIAEKYPASDLSNLATDVVSYLDSGRSPVSGNGNMRPLPVSIIHEDQKITEEPDSPASYLFSMNPEAPQVVMLVYLPDSVNANTLLYDVARHNFATFAVRDFDLRPLQLSPYSALTVNGFASLREAEHYTSLLAHKPGVLPSKIRPVIISESDLNMLLHGRASLDLYLKAVESKRFHDAQTAVLSPGIYEIATLEDDEP
ncbi:MAG: tetratricopeptide repeat protein [Muribaculaceae bacterium]|nr:tetratricopeptide repeat protein [Muribaculaceae bacterium]